MKMNITAAAFFFNGTLSTKQRPNHQVSTSYFNTGVLDTDIVIVFTFEINVDKFYSYIFIMASKI